MLIGLIKGDHAEADQARETALLLSRCRRAFPDFGDPHPTSRLGSVIHPLICRAWKRERVGTHGCKLIETRTRRGQLAWKQERHTRAELAANIARARRPE